jgi:hypothetical protein
MTDADEGSGDRSGTDAARDDDAIRALVRRLSRPHRSGGRVVERAALMAEGADFSAVLAWIEAHGGEAEAPRARPARGLHAPRLAPDEVAVRFVVPAAAVA